MTTKYTTMTRALMLVHKHLHKVRPDDEIFRSINRMPRMRHRKASRWQWESRAILII